MAISKINITNVRNFKSLVIKPSKDINVFFGENGSGKSSILESIYLLSLVRSFRTNKIKSIINNKAKHCVVFAEMTKDDKSLFNVGVSRNITDDVFKISIDGNLQSTKSELAFQIPLQLIHSKTFDLLEGLPEIRRNFLDWGVFHVKQGVFFSCWKKAKNILKQRNALLKEVKVARDNQKSLECIRDQLKIWDFEFSKACESINDMRKEYFEEIKPFFFNILYELTSDIDNVEISYYSGWGEGKLENVLSENLERDFYLGYTYSGIQRADIKIRKNGYAVSELLSRGQLKLMICALKLAQGVLYNHYTKKKCIYLIDDLPAELDVKHRMILFNVLCRIDSQIFLTCTDLESILYEIPKKTNLTKFHVKQNSVSMII